MAEIVLSSDELTVLGGPASITVDVDFGPQGDRGSLILYGMGKPDEVTLPETPKVYDTYINVLSSDDEYMFMYQYLSGQTTPAWTKIFKLTPNMYNQNIQKTFVDGIAEINIPVAAIVPADLIGNYLAENFSVQINVLNDAPVAVSTTVAELSIINNLVSLPITLNAVEYSGGSWTSLNDAKTVHVSITVV